MTDRIGLGVVLNPESIAVVGASADPGRIGGRPIRFLAEHGFNGSIYPVNPKHAVIQGLRAFPSLSAINGTVDQVLSAVSASATPALVAECSKLGVKSIVIFGAGFAEAGADGVRIQNEALSIARESGIRLLGPNCMGFINVRSSIYSTFNIAFEHPRWRAGNVGLVSQSGAFGAHFLSLGRSRDLSVSQWITTGNESDIDLAECISYCVDDPHTRVIAAYVETCRDGNALLESFARARRAGKPIVLLKAGRSMVGARSSISHTGGFVVDDAVYDAICREYAVHRATTLTEFEEVVYAFSRGLCPRDNRIAIVTVSGGVGALMADAADTAGLVVPEISESSKAQLEDILPFGAAAFNPIDITAQLLQDFTIFESAMTLVCESNEFGSVVVFLTMLGFSPVMREGLFPYLQKLRGRHPDRMIALAILGPPDVLEELEDLGYMVLPDPIRAVEVIGVLAQMSRRIALGRESESQVKSVAVRVAPPSLPPNEFDAYVLLAAAGFSVPRVRVARSAPESAMRASEIGFPVVIKILASELSHKTEIGGIVVDVGDCDQARAAFERVTGSVTSLAPHVKIDGVLVAEQARPGVELIVGVARDPTFGHVVAVGFGGVFVETLNDVSLRLAPVTETGARDMINDLKGVKMLGAIRGQEARDVDSIVEVIVRLSRLVADWGDAVESVEINPLVVYAAGEGCLPLDIVISLPTRATAPVSAGRAQL